MAVLKRIGAMSAAKVSGAIGAVIGLLFGIIAALIGTAAFALRGSAALGVGFGVFSIILFPIIYGILSFAVGAVSAFLYNAVAERIGGIEMEFQQKRR